MSRQTLKDILKSSKAKNAESVRDILLEYVKESDKEHSDRAERFVAAIEGVERIANIIADATKSIDVAPQALKKGIEEVTSSFIKELDKRDVADRKVTLENKELHIANMPEFPKAIEIKNLPKQSNARVEGLLVSLLEEIRDLSEAIRSEEKEENKTAGLPQVGAGIEMMKRDRRRRSKYAVAPKEVADGTVTLFTWPDNWVSGSMRLFVGSARLYKEKGDWTEAGNRQVNFTYAPPVGQTPLADYETT